MDHGRKEGRKASKEAGIMNLIEISSSEKGKKDKKAVATGQPEHAHGDEVLQSTKLYRSPSIIGW
jgi:hypothetical protein